MVTIINKTRRMRVFILPHESLCEALGQCRCNILGGRDQKRIASSLTIPAGGRVSGLPDTVLSVLAIEKARKIGDIAVVKDKTSSRKNPSSKSTRKRRKRRKKSKDELASPA